MLDLVVGNGLSPLGPVHAGFAVTLACEMGGSLPSAGSMSGRAQ